MYTYERIGICVSVCENVQGREKKVSKTILYLGNLVVYSFLLMALVCIYLCLFESA